MRLFEFDEQNVSGLLGILNFLRFRSNDLKVPAVYDTNTIIDMVKRTGQVFDYAALVKANEMEPAVKNLIKSLNKDEVELNSVDADNEAEADNDTTPDKDAEHVAKMAQRAAKKSQGLESKQTNKNALNEDPSFKQKLKTTFRKIDPTVKHRMLKKAWELGQQMKDLRRYAELDPQSPEAAEYNRKAGQWYRLRSLAGAHSKNYYKAKKDKTSPYRAFTESDRPGRTINVDGRIWKYQIGKSNVVAYATDNDEKRVIDFSKLTGWSWDDIERSNWKEGGWRITPKHIADWLKKPKSLDARAPSVPWDADFKHSYNSWDAPSPVSTWPDTSETDQ